ncbi:MAG TPA: putative Ig domain-containing protein [Thermoplasmata archaeon]|jgi:hypothetical protein
MMKRVRKLKVIEVKPRRRYFWAGPVVAVFLALIFILNAPISVLAQDDYTFGTELVNKGTSTSPTEKNTENAVYNSLQEADQYADTIFTATTENVVVGTGGGAAFPGALTTDDASRRTYTEANTGTAPTYQILRPTSDGSPITFVNFPVSPTTNYDKVDETTVDGNGDTDYNEGTTNAQEDTYGMSDASDPGGTPNIDVTIWHISDDEGAVSNLQVGVDIGGTNYIGWQGDLNSGVYTNYSYEWVLNPSTSAEWTLTQVNALNTFLLVTDANPDTRTTQVALLIEFNPSVTYQLDAQITYSGVTSTAQTISYNVLCQGYRNGDTENVGVYAWNYITSGWDLKTTISAGSDTDYNFDLTSQQRDSGTNEVKLRLVDASNGDATQTVAYLDVLKVSRLELGYALDVELTATTVAQYGDITLRIKGYTSAETFKANVWNYTSSAYDLNKLSITSGSNAWQTTVDLCDDHHRSGTTVKIQFVDGTASTSDFVQDTLYLDVVWVTRYHTAPTITLYGATPTEINLGTSITFWATYSDYDNEAPTYVYAHIGSSDYSMTENGSDTVYYDGKFYGFSKADIPAGNITYYFKVKDANSIDVTTSPVALSVNTKPTLTLDGVTPTGGNPGTYTFFVTYTDADSNSPANVKATIGGADYIMTYNGSGGGYHYDKAMSGGTTVYSFKTEDYRSGVVSTTPKNLVVNNPPTLSGFGRAPGDPVYVTTELNFTMTFTDLDDDLPTDIKWRSGADNLTMSEVDPADTTTSDGKEYYLEMYLTTHGLHNYDFGASDGQYWTTGGSSSVTIDNRAPDISNGPGAHIDQYRNAGWYYVFTATDDDSDTVDWTVGGPAWLSIDSNGNLSGTTDDAPAEYGFTVYANDSYSGSDSYAFILHINNRDSSISSNGNTTQIEGTFLAYEIVASDPDGDSLSYALSSNASWASISGAWVNGTATDLGWYEFTVWANDSYGGSDFQHWYLTVNAPLENSPPSFTSSPFTQWQHGQTYEYAAACEDAELDLMDWTLQGNCTAFLVITPDGFMAIVSGLIPSMGYWEVQISIDDGTNPLIWQNFTLSALNQGPYFTNMPENKSYVNESYEYIPTVQDNNTDELIFGLEDSPSWLSINVTTGRINGTPTLNGSYPVHLWVSDGLMTGWVNFTIEIDLNDPNVMDLLTLIVGLVFGFGLIALSILDKRHGIWPTYTGLAWIIISVVALYPVGIGWMILGLGIGLIMWIEGAMEYAASRGQKT